MEQGDNAEAEQRAGACAEGTAVCLPAYFCLPAFLCPRKYMLALGLRLQKRS